jgi:SAM-dependent methyltransferase
MDDKLRFAADLYQGTAEYYDRYRLPYPEAMTEDLIARTGVSGQGRLLDLACGTGQLAFPLRRSFAEIWAVDREPDFAQMVQAKAGKLGAGNIRPVTADAETLDAEPGHWEFPVETAVPADGDGTGGAGSLRDITVAHQARVYNYALGGKDHFAADWAVVEEWTKGDHAARDPARDTRL